MAATAHLTAVAPDNEMCTVQSAPARLPRRKASLQAQDQAMYPTTIGRASTRGRSVLWQPDERMGLRDRARHK